MALTKRAQRIRREKLDAACTAWNDAHPIGTAVMVKLDGQAEPIGSYTRSPAQVLSGHTAVVWLEGIRGCYALERVRAAATPEERSVVIAELKKQDFA